MTTKLIDLLKHLLVLCLVALTVLFSLRFTEPTAPINEVLYDLKIEVEDGNLK